MGHCAMRRLLAGAAWWSLGLLANGSAPAAIPAITVPATGIPIAFEENRGQAPADVRFLVRSSGLTAYLRSSGASFRFRQRGDVSESPPPHPRSGRPASSAPPPAPAEFTLRLHGSAQAATIEGLDPLPGHSNYLRGNDPKQWITDVPHFARVRYRDIYPGIDQVFHGAQRKIEYDLIVAPGADPSPILLEIGGAEKVANDNSGGIAAHTATGSLQHRVPIAYQEAGSTKVAVRVDYELRSDSKIALRVGPYDRSKPLVIDPVVDYSTYLGGGMDDSGLGIGVDASGNVYVSGQTVSADFPVKSPLQPALNDYDSFVTKINAAGDAIVYSTFFGGSDVEKAWALAVLPDGRAVIAGETQSTDLPLAHPIQSTLKGLTNAFVAELNAEGNGLVFSTYLGGRTFDRAYAVTFDAVGNVYIAGQAGSTDFPSTSVITACSVGGAGFVSKLSPDGTQLLYSVCIGGTTLGTGAQLPLSSFAAIAVDRSQQAYVAGYTDNIDFPIVNAAQAYRLPVVVGDNEDVAVVAKLNAAGNALLYSTYIGGAFVTFARGIAVDSAGNAYVGGTANVFGCQPTPCSNIDFPLVDPADPQPGVGPYTGYVVKLSAAGDKFLYSTYIATCNGRESDGVIAVDDFGNAYLGMYTNCADQVPNFAANLTKIDAGGRAFTNYVIAGSAGAGAIIEGIALDAAANVYVTGHTYPGGVPLVNPIQPNPGVGPTYFTDAFVTKVSFSTAPSTVSVSSSANPSELLQPVTFTVTVPGPGRVQLLEGPNVLAETVPLLGAFQTTFTLATLSAGEHAINAVYLPATSAPVASPVLTQRVALPECIP